MSCMKQNKLINVEYVNMNDKSIQVDSDKHSLWRDKNYVLNGFCYVSDLYKKITQDKMTLTDAFKLINHVIQGDVLVDDVIDRLADKFTVSPRRFLFDKFFSLVVQFQFSPCEFSSPAYADDNLWKMQWFSEYAPSGVLHDDIPVFPVGRDFSLDHDVWGCMFNIPLPWVPDVVELVPSVCEFPCTILDALNVAVVLVDPLFESGYKPLGCKYTNPGKYGLLGLAMFGEYLDVLGETLFTNMEVDWIKTAVIAKYLCPPDELLNDPYWESFVFLFCVAKHLVCDNRRLYIISLVTRIADEFLIIAGKRDRGRDVIICLPCSGDVSCFSYFIRNTSFETRVWSLGSLSPQCLRACPVFSYGVKDDEVGGACEFCDGDHDVDDSDSAEIDMLCNDCDDKHDVSGFCLFPELAATELWSAFLNVYVEYYDLDHGLQTFACYDQFICSLRVGEDYIIGDPGSRYFTTQDACRRYVLTCLSGECLEMASHLPGFSE